MVGWFGLSGATIAAQIYADERRDVFIIDRQSAKIFGKFRCGDIRP